MDTAAERIDVIFWEAAQRAPGPERDAYLARACGDDRELRQRVEKLVRAQPKVDGLFYFNKLNFQVVTQHGSDSPWFGAGYGDFIDGVAGLNNTSGGPLIGSSPSPEKFPE